MKPFLNSSNNLFEDFDAVSLPSPWLTVRANDDFSTGSGGGASKKKNRPPTLPEAKREFKNQLKDLSSGRFMIREVYSDWLEFSAIYAYQCAYLDTEVGLKRDEYAESLDNKLKQVTDRYSEEEVQKFKNLYLTAIYGVVTEFNDFLGAMASELELVNLDSDQYFTPYSVSKMMAQLTFGDRGKTYNGEMIRFYEPACGAGGMVIAAAETLLSQKMDPRSCMQVLCTDISRDAFNATYFQLSALGLQAVVQHGNTISLDIWEERSTPQFKFFTKALQKLQAERQKELEITSRLRNMFSLFDTPGLNTGQAPERKEVEPISTVQTVEEITQQFISDVSGQGQLFNMENFEAAEKIAKKKKRPKPEGFGGQQGELF